jgi:hypothetical protein
MVAYQSERGSVTKQLFEPYRGLGHFGYFPVLIEKLRGHQHFGKPKQTHQCRTILIPAADCEFRRSYGRTHDESMPIMLNNKPKAALIKPLENCLLVSEPTVVRPNKANKK